MASTSDPATGGRAAELATGGRAAEPATGGRAAELATGGRAAEPATGGRAASLRADSRDQEPDADPESVARKILLDQLTGRARSRSDLAKKLAQKNVPDDIAT